jgi:2-polyprenyl-3-methyl-5-hydroxy-6-metoxy-1,4-benzoquinol methylase
MTTSKEKIIKGLEKATNTLISTLLLLEEENSNGKQYDYVTSSTLSSHVDHVNKLAQKIDKIVYQD